MVRIRQIEVQPASRSHEPGELRQQLQIVRRTFQVPESREETRNESASTRLQRDRSQVTAKYRTTCTRIPQQVAREIAAYRLNPFFAKGDQMSSISTTGIQDHTSGNPKVRKQGCNLQTGLIEAPVTIQALVFGSEPVLEPVPGGTVQDKLAARPNVETTSSASAAEKAVGSHASGWRRRSFRRLPLRRETSPKGRPMNSGSTSK